MKHNFIAKNMNKYNKNTVHIDKKKESKKNPELLIDSDIEQVQTTLCHSSLEENKEET